MTSEEILKLDKQTKKRMEKALYSLLKLRDEFGNIHNELHIGCVGISFKTISKEYVDSWECSGNFEVILDRIFCPYQNLFANLQIKKKVN